MVKHTLAALLWLLLFITGCKPLIATYDEYSYTQLSSVKVDVLNVIDKSTEDYTTHAAEVADVLTETHKAMEYDIHKPKNEIMAKMWSVMDGLLTDTTALIPNQPKSHLKGLLASWKKEGHFSGKTFVNEAKQQIGEGFDLLMELESRKIHDNDERITSFIAKNQ